MFVHIETPFTGRRLRERRVDEVALGERAAREAKQRDDWVVLCEHGGSVCNSYGYPAETECVLALSNPLGYALVWTGRANANKVTLRSAALSCLGGAGVLFDKRSSDQSKSETLEWLKRLHEDIVPAMEVLAVASMDD